MDGVTSDQQDVETHNDTRSRAYSRQATRCSARVHLGPERHDLRRQVRAATADVDDNYVDATSSSPSTTARSGPTATSRSATVLPARLHAERRSRSILAARAGGRQPARRRTRDQLQLPRRAPDPGSPLRRSGPAHPHRHGGRQSRRRAAALRTAAWQLEHAASPEPHHATRHPLCTTTSAHRSWAATNRPKGC